jgi:hypothetical protein
VNKRFSYNFRKDLTELVNPVFSRAMPQREGGARRNAVRNRGAAAGQAVETREIPARPALRQMERFPRF